MSHDHTRVGLLRTRWSAIGAAVAVTLGAGGLTMTHAAIDSGERPVTISIAAERILDTRSNLGLSGRFGDASPRDLRVTGSVPVASGGSKTVVPPDAIGVLVNVTVVTPTHDGFLSLRPKGAAGEPTTSTVNFTPGSIEPNAATVDLNDGGIQIWVETSSDAGSADVLIDVVGYTVDHTHDDRYYTESEADEAFVAYAGTIPPGTTVTGSWAAAPSTDAAGSVGFDEITLPAMAGATLPSVRVNMGAATANGADNDATCTGTAATPTAPPGRLCFYVGFQTGLTALAGFNSNGDQTRGAAVRVTGEAGATNRYARGGWAYTEPLAGTAAAPTEASTDDDSGNATSAISGG